MLAKRIRDFLNNGDTVAADFPLNADGHCFVRVRPVPNPTVPREERRYLNSRWSMWEYWWYEFRRMEFRPGWKESGFDYDEYLTADEKILTKTETGFFVALRKWVPGSIELKHYTESDCPE